MSTNRDGTDALEAALRDDMAAPNAAPKPFVRPFETHPGDLGGGRPRGRVAVRRKSSGVASTHSCR